MDRIILGFSMHRSKYYFCKKYGRDWFQEFKRLSYQHFNNIIKYIPDIGDSIFLVNYRFAPIYFAWYKSFDELNIVSSDIDQEIWILNENLMNTFPKFLLKLYGRLYLNSFEKKAPKQIERQRLGTLHPYDWKIDFKHIDKNSFEITIRECAYKKLAKDFNLDRILPGICRMDYLMANCMGHGFTRTKTLGDGNDCCNCTYKKVGYCEWSPEKGFIDRK